MFENLEGLLQVSLKFREKERLCKEIRRMVTILGPPQPPMTRICWLSITICECPYRGKGFVPGTSFFSQVNASKSSCQMSIQLEKNRYNAHDCMIPQLF